MKPYFLFLTFLLFKGVSAQNFIELNQDPPIAGVNSSCSAFGDVDGDGDLDFALTGFGNGIGRVSKIYINEGDGVFLELANTPFDEVANGSVTFSDVDGDNDQDILITGENNQEERIAKLYLNDGAGSYTESTQSNFHGVLASDAAFIDVDNDGDSDVLIVGTLTPFLGISSKLYINNGDGVFNESTTTSFEAVRNGSIDFTDVDGDNDQDILIVGENDSFNEIANLYLNDGAGNFMLAINTPFDGVNNGDVEFADFDGDADQDLLITGLNSDFTPISKLYLNDGTGVFIEVENTSIIPVQFSSIGVTDIDNDGDNDVLITGRFIDEQVTKLYTNDGTGNFTEVLELPLIDVSSGHVVFADIDNDNDSDLLITGSCSTVEGVLTKSKLYLNETTTFIINKSALSLNFEIFPNPSYSRELVISLSFENTRDFRIKLYDSIGNLVSTQIEYVFLNEQQVAVDFRQLSSGIYFIEVTDGEIFGVKKIVLK